MSALHSNYPARESSHSAAVFVALVALLLPGTSVAADAQRESNEGKRVTVFQLEGVNVPQHILDASGELLPSDFVRAGLVVADWERGYEEVTGCRLHSRVAPVAEVDEDPSVNVVVTVNNEIHLDRPIESQADESGVSSSTTVESPAASEEIEGTAEQEPAPECVLTDQLKAEIARKLKCDLYVDGKLIWLGARVRVSLRLVNSDGDILRIEEMDASNDNDLLNIYQRIATAFAGGKEVVETRSETNATLVETSQTNRHERVRNFNGAAIGAGMNITNEEKLGVITIAYDGMWELGKLRIGVLGALNFSNSKGVAAFGIDFSLYGYLTDWASKPYLGGGVGVFMGDRLNHERESEDGTTNLLGFEVFPSIGIELFNGRRMRMHLEFRYNLLLDVGGNLGHGPSAFIGLSFR